MESVIYTIVDSSASFKADGKGGLMRNLARILMSAASKDRYKSIKPRFCIWTNDLNEITDAEEIEFSGRAVLEPLIGAVEAAEEGTRFLLLSDGLFDGEAADKLRESLKTKRSVFVPVAVGADADESALKNLAVPVGYCYDCVNLLAAFDEICFREFYGEDAK